MEKIGAPSKAGANLIARLVTNKGTFQQFVTNTLGTIELWAFSTTSQGRRDPGRALQTPGTRRGPEATRRPVPGRIRPGRDRAEIPDDEGPGRKRGRRTHGRPADRGGAGEGGVNGCRYSGVTEITAFFGKRSRDPNGTAEEFISQKLFPLWTFVI